MRPVRIPLVIALLLAAVAIIAIPASSLAIPEVGERSNGFSKADERYLATYVECWEELKAQCGRNIVDDGMASGQPPSEARVAESTARMDAWLNPPPTPVPASSVSETVAAPTPTTTSVAPSTASGGYAIPESIVMCESGGDYGAVNPSSGAAGAYQIMPSTSAAYGCDMSSPAGQDACAAEIYSDVGSSAWSCAG